MASLPPTVRPATEADIPALLALLLTSFRQFSLFSILYSPLDTNPDLASDTIFFWRRRLLLDLLNPCVSIIVAELPSDTSSTLTRPHAVDPSAKDDVQAQSWLMLDWASQHSLPQSSSEGSAKPTVVGFAIWKERGGLAAKEGEKKKKGWYAKCRGTCYFFLSCTQTHSSIHLNHMDRARAANLILVFVSRIRNGN